MRDYRVFGHTPENPCPKAVAKVINPLPVPTTCPYCKGEVQLVTHEQLYGRSYGNWPWAYLCTGDCWAYVGIHPGTAIPLGTLADPETREARKALHAALDPLWQHYKYKREKRTGVYRRMAQAMGMAEHEFHVGWFDAATCHKALQVCQDLIREDLYE